MHPTTQQYLAQAIAADARRMDRLAVHRHDQDVAPPTVRTTIGHALVAAGHRIAADGMVARPRGIPPDPA